MAPIKDPHPDHVYGKCAHVWDSRLKCHGKTSINYETCNFCEKDRIPSSRALNRKLEDIGFFHIILCDGSEHWYYSIERPW
ncbi:unnamed protein product [Fusarium graminearum]|nr:unnamed protein product [Fusarium graminearum]